MANIINTARLAELRAAKNAGATNQPTATPQTGTGLSSAPTAPVTPTYNEQATTNYGGKGSALNEILNSKKQYDTGVANNNSGLKNWAANNAQQYYGQLDPNESAAVKGMNTQQLIDYINGKNTPTNAVGTGTPAAVVAGPVMQLQTTSQQPYQSTYTGPDMTGMTQQIKDIFGNRQASELQKLRDARDVALQGYNSQETLAKQNAYDNRNQADVTNLQNEQRMRETMANQGLNTDGQNLTLQAAQNAQRLGALGDINRQEANTLQDIGQQRALLQNNAANNELALTQQINSDQANALYDLMKYGDQQSFNVDQSNYGRYRDDINQQFANDQFDWRKQTDLANLLGSINGQQTLASKAQDFGQQMDLANLLGTYNGQSTLAGKNANLNAALQVGDATGRLVNPQTDYSGLLRQAANPNTPLNMAGQNQQLNTTQTMASLTGMMPDGRGGFTPTTAEQQRQLGNLWDVASQTGTIPNQLADMYGIPRGTETQAAKQFALNLGLQKDQNNLASDKFTYDKLKDQAAADAGTKATPAQVKQILQNYQLNGQDSDGKAYKYIPGPGKPARTDWVKSTVQSMVNSGYDNSTIEQVLRSAGVTSSEEDSIFGGK